MDCPSCGTATADPEQRFCAECGTNIAPVVPPTAYGQATRITGPLFADDLPPPPPPPPPAPPPTAPPTYAAPPPMPPPAFAPPSMPPPATPPPASYAAEPRGHMRPSVVLLAAAAVVAALIGAGGVVLLFGADDPESGSTAEDRDGQDRTTDAGTQGSTDPTATATETESAEPEAFRCWNGGPAVTRLASCPPPIGADGLAWVFPSATDSSCVVEPGAQRATEADCAPLVNGAAVRFHYSEWRSRDALENYYSGNTVEALGAPGGRDDLIVARAVSRDSSVGYKVAIYYVDPMALWSVTIYAADEAEYLAALDKLEVRPFRQLRGKRV